MVESAMISGNGDPFAQRAQVALKTHLKTLSFGSLYLPRETTNEPVRRKRCDRIPKVFSALIFSLAIRKIEIPIELQRDSRAQWAVRSSARYPILVMRMFRSGQSRRERNYQTVKICYLQPRYPIYPFSNTVWGLEMY